MSLLPILDIVGKLADKLIPDPAERHEFELNLAKVNDQELQRQHDEMMGQIATNTAEATNQNMFVAGWRPFIGWVGGVGLAYSFVVEPLADWTAKVAFHYGSTFPVLDSSQLMTLVMAMLGFGGLRTYEKVQGIPDSQVPNPVPQGSDTVSNQGTLPQKKKVLGIPWPF